MSIDAFDLGPESIKNIKPLTPSDLKILFEALTLAPSFLSKRFIMMELLGWDDTMMNKNIKMLTEETHAIKTGDKFGGIRL